MLLFWLQMQGNSKLICVLTLLAWKEWANWWTELRQLFMCNYLLHGSVVARVMPWPEGVIPDFKKDLRASKRTIETVSLHPCSVFHRKQSQNEWSCGRVLQLARFQTQWFVQKRKGLKRLRQAFSHWGCLYHHTERAQRGREQGGTCTYATTRSQSHAVLH